MRLSAILLLLVFVLMSCATPTGQGEATSVGEVATAEVTSAEITSEEVSDSITETEPIENIHPTLKPTDLSKEDIKIGASVQEYYKLVEEGDDISYAPYFFLIDKNGDSLVVKEEGFPGTIAEVHVFSGRDSLPTDADFAQIEIGMSILEVVELVGLPVGVEGNGFTWAYWLSEEGFAYGLDWDDDVVTSMISNKKN